MQLLYLTKSYTPLVESELRVTYCAVWNDILVRRCLSEEISMLSGYGHVDVSLLNFYQVSM